MGGSEEVWVEVGRGFGGYWDEEVREGMKGWGGLELGVDEGYGWGKDLDKMGVVVGFVFGVDKGGWGGREGVNEIREEMVEKGYGMVGVGIGEMREDFVKGRYGVGCVVW